MIGRIDKVLTAIFSLIWISIIFIDYWYYHPEYAASLENFQYTNTIFIITLLGVGVYFGITRLNDKKWVRFLLNGSGIFLVFLLISGIILWTHYPKITGKSLAFTGGITYLGKIIYNLFGTYLTFTACYVLGSFFINKLFSFSFSKQEGALVKIGLGITFISFVLMVLGALNLLSFVVVSLLLLTILGVGWKTTLQFLKSSLLNPLAQVEQLNWIGILSFFLILIFISLNFLSNVRPFPFGFDALAVYLNVPKLISESQGLIEGYSPYYWSLFISIGHIVFNKLEIVIALSIGGGILSLFAIYEISKNWLDTNFSLMTTLIFYSLPLVNYQSFRDVKTDLGLLFILLTVVLVLIKWLSKVDTESFKQKIIPFKKAKALSKAIKKKQKIVKPTNPINKVQVPKGILENYLSEAMQLIIVMGVLSGMAIGIKLTTLMLIFGVLSVFSFINGGIIGFLTNFSLTFFVILVGNIDTSLRPYHFSADQLKWISLAIGVMGLIYMIYKEKKAFFNLVKTACLYIGFIGIIYLPWPIKNYKETGKISIQTFIEGKKTFIPEK